MDNSPETFKSMRNYVFHRAEGFYVVQLRHDADAMACVPLNPGTLRIERVNDDGSLSEVFRLQ